ncbi:STAS domain-containing protein [Streptacidiphilus sp. PB12-B1b]|uniref:STAS domain-containing protein n=1 Tax=Streptacidiphilus sp. PB12-B1b TaxID=2705012 RepID=UPI0015F83BCE|nr:STAS domain-containing protein [Streptacidiphilus sp. PB12-B1b]QMU77535.1 STAS domain-containing protein [Streptacidiphilus sp. PB12-B1b]
MSGLSRLTVLVLDGRSTAQILLAGELDQATAVDLDTAVSLVLADPQVQHIEVDVALVEFCDTGGLSALMAAALRAADEHVLLNLVQIRLPLQRVLDAAKLGGLLCPPD